MKFLPQILLIAAIIAVVSGAIALFIQPSDSEGVHITLPEPTTVISAQVGVYATGAIQFPGMSSLSEGDRVQQALQAAGGPTADADLTAVNLASLLNGENHWHIPAISESAPALTRTNANLSSSAYNTKISKINVNSANVELLKTLPGIGEVRAKAMVGHRDANGPFPTVNGIGPATLESIRSLIEAR